MPTCCDNILSYGDCLYIEYEKYGTDNKSLCILGIYLYSYYNTKLQMLNHCLYVVRCGYKEFWEGYIKENAQDDLFNNADLKSATKISREKLLAMLL